MAEVTDWVGRARALAALVGQHRDEGESERRLPMAIEAEIRAGGFFSLWVPQALGGAEVDLETMLRVVEEFSRQDGSVGWNVMIAANDGLLWGYLDPSCATRLMDGDPGSVIAGSILAGSGTAARVEGGYLLNGRWPFASGCRHADWLIAGCTITENGEARTGANGAPMLKAFLVPPDDCTILDTWHTTGMRGTGSHDFLIENVFVPLGREFDYPGTSAFNTGPLYTTPVPNVWGPNISAVALGIAREAIDSFVEIATAKRSRFSRSSIADRETIQEKLGLAEALLRSGRALLYETVRANWGTLASGQSLSDEETALGRLAAATASRNAVEAVDLVFHAAGTTSIYERSRLERCFRDVHMVPQHAVAGPLGFITAGRQRLGLSLTP
jgi:alkylation response protein AidB-like acyl-CoA dehydrogenase